MESSDLASKSSSVKGAQQKGPVMSGLWASETLASALVVPTGELKTLKETSRVVPLKDASNPSSRKQRHEDHHKFEASPVYTASSNRSGLRLYNENLSLK